jgi:hypothetical protein
MVPGCFSSPTSIALVVQLQSKLNLPWIIRSIACRSDFTEGGAGEVARVSDGCDAVATEVRCVEVRMVEDVEELSPELHREAVAELDPFEGGEVQPMEARTNAYSRPGAQDRQTGERDASGRSVWNWISIRA